MPETEGVSQSKIDSCSTKVKFHPLPADVHEETMLMEGFEDKEANTMERAFVRIRIPMKQVVTEDDEEGENSKQGTIETV